MNSAKLTNLNGFLIERKPMLNETCERFFKKPRQ